MELDLSILDELFDETPKKEQEEQADSKQQRINAGAAALKERNDETERAERLKPEIITQIEKGVPPQVILCTAIKAIGLLSHDLDFISACEQQLNGAYSDLAQQSILFNDAEASAERISERAAEYVKKTRKQVERQARGYAKLEKDLKAVLITLDELSKQDWTECPGGNPFLTE